MLKIPISPLTVFAWLPWHYGPLFTCPPPVFPLLSILDDMVNITRLPWQHAFSIPLAFSVPLASQNKQPAHRSHEGRDETAQETQPIKKMSANIINFLIKYEFCLSRLQWITSFFFHAERMWKVKVLKVLFMHMYCILCLNLLHLACCAILNTTPWYYKMHLNLINLACWVILKDSLK